MSAQLREIYYKDDDHGISNQVEPLHVATGHRMTLIKAEITKSFFPFCQNCSCLTFCIEDLEELWCFRSRFDFKKQRRQKCHSRLQMREARPPDDVNQGRNYKIVFSFLSKLFLPNILQSKSWRFGLRFC